MEPELVPSAAQVGKCNRKNIPLKCELNLSQLSLCIL